MCIEFHSVCQQIATRIRRFVLAESAVEAYFIPEMIAIYNSSKSSGETGMRFDTDLSDCFLRWSSFRSDSSQFG